MIDSQFENWNRQSSFWIVDDYVLKNGQSAAYVGEMLLNHGCNLMADYRVVWNFGSEICVLPLNL